MSFKIGRISEYTAIQGTAVIERYKSTDPRQWSERQ